MSLPETVLKLLEKSIDMIGDEDCEFPEEDFSNIFKDTFKSILKETTNFSEMDSRKLKKRVEELEAENKALKDRLAELENQLVTNIVLSLD